MEPDSQENNSSEAIEEVDLTEIIGSLPETLESFTYNCPPGVSDLESKFNFKAFITTLIHMGVREFCFNNINFGSQNDKNKELFEEIFLEPVANKSVSYLKFYNCPGVLKMENLVKKLDKLSSLSLCKCSIKGKFSTLRFLIYLWI